MSARAKKPLPHRVSPPESGQVRTGSPCDSCSTAGPSKIHTTSDEEERTHAAKRKLPPSSQAGPRRKAYLERSRSPFDSFGFRGGDELHEDIFNRILTMPRDRLPVVAEICFRLYPCGPNDFDGYEYTAMIKTDPDQPKLSGSRVAELIKGMGYAGEISDITADTRSPHWTRVEGLILHPSKEGSDAPSLSSDSSSDHGDSSEE